MSERLFISANTSYCVDQLYPKKSLYLLVVVIERYSRVFAPNYQGGMIQSKKSRITKLMT